LAAPNLPEEKQILKFIEKVPFPAKDKKTWSEQIRATGFSQELADSIHKKLAGPKTKKPDATDLSHFTIEFNGLVNRWRLASQSRNFAKR
jgi:hypothetical protein